MRAVRVGEVARGVDLMRFDRTKEFDREIDVVLGDRALADRAGLVEGQILEVEPLPRGCCRRVPRPSPRRGG